MFRQAQQPLMRGPAVLLLSVVLLTACSTQSTPMPSVVATSTPDIYTLALGNIQAQSTLEAMQGTASAIEARLTATAYAPTQEAMETATERAWTTTGWTATASVEQTASSASSTATEQAIQATEIGRHTSELQSQR